MLSTKAYAIGKKNNAVETKYPMECQDKVEKESKGKKRLEKKFCSLKAQKKEKKMVDGIPLRRHTKKELRYK